MKKAAAYPKPFKGLILFLALIILCLAAIELQTELFLNLLQKEVVSSEAVFTIQAAVYLSLGGFLILVFRKYLSKKSHAETILSERELLVFKAILNGQSNKEIEEGLFIEKSTLKSHINRIYRKLDVSDREDLRRRYS